MTSDGDHFTDISPTILGMVHTYTYTQARIRSRTLQTGPKQVELVSFDALDNPGVHLSDFGTNGPEYIFMNLPVEG
jgi:hypothetical protein